MNAFYFLFINVNDQSIVLPLSIRFDKNKLLTHLYVVPIFKQTLVGLAFLLVKQNSLVSTGRISYCSLTYLDVLGNDVPL